jgi:hypothetical protein
MNFTSLVSRALKRAEAMACALCNKPNAPDHDCRFRAVVRPGKQVRKANAAGRTSTVVYHEGWIGTRSGGFWRCQHLHADKAAASRCASSHLRRCQTGERRLVERTEAAQVRRSNALSRVVVDRPRRPTDEIPVR